MGRRRPGIRPGTGPWLAGMVIMCLLVLVPVFILVKYSVSDRASLIVPPGEPVPLWPRSPDLAAFRYLLRAGDFLAAAGASLGIALGTVGLASVVGAGAGFALVRYRVPGKAVLLFFLLSVRLFPDVASAVPVSRVFLTHGLGNVAGVCLVHALLALPYVIYIDMGVFDAIPRDLEEQAQILGAGRLTAFLRVVLPVALPGLAAGAIYAFLLSWNEFIFAYFLLFYSEAATLPVHMKKILDWSPQQNILAATSVIISVPVILFTFVVQKYMRAGITAGAIR